MKNTLPLSQANFDALMRAIDTTARRVSQVEDEIPAMKAALKDQQAINAENERRIAILESGKASRYEGDE